MRDPRLLPLTRRVLVAAVLAGCAGPRAASGPESQLVDAAHAYLNGITRLSARFTQTGTDGVAAGYVWMERPGRLRVEYTRPRPRLMLANHGRFLVADRLTHAVTTMPLANTPLAILLAEDIPFSGPVTVSGVQQSAGVLAINLVKTASPNAGRLTVQFATDPMRLIGLVIQDASGRTDTLALSDVALGTQALQATYTYSQGES